MKWRDLGRMIIANLNRMRGRVLLTVLGVVVGTTAVVLLVSLGIGLQSSTSSEIANFGDLTVITVFEGGSMGGMGASDDAGPALDRDALVWLGSLDHVVIVTPRVGIRGASELVYGRTSTFGQVTGIRAEVAGELGWRLADGRARLGGKQIVVGHEVFSGESTRFAAVSSTDRRQAAPTQPVSVVTPEDLVGRTVTMVLTKFDEDGGEVARRERLRVAGVLEPASGVNDYTVFMDIDEVEDYNRWFSGERRDPRASYGEVIVKVDDRQNVADVESAITDAGYGAFSAQSMLGAINQVFLIVQIFLGGLGGVTLLVAAILIVLTMTTAIYERTKEIGIMKALGASNNDVLRIFLGEAGAIGLMGGTIGVVVSLVAGVAIDFFLRGWIAGASQGAGVPDHLVVTPAPLVIFAIVFATLIGLASGIFPALRAANMKPLQALRAE